MREAQVQEAFVAHLQAEGWTVTLGDASYVDVIAKRGDERLLAEVKGVTSSVGTDVDTLYGQILRRISGKPDEEYAVVVPARILTSVQRVSSTVRAKLGIALFVVAEDGTVERVED